MVDADYGEERAVRDLNGQCWGGEGAIFGVNWDWIVRVCGVAAYVADDAEFAGGRGKGVGIQEWSDGRGEVDAVDEDV